MSGRRGARGAAPTRSERSEDGTPAARDPPEGCRELRPRDPVVVALGRGTPKFFHSCTALERDPGFQEWVAVECVEKRHQPEYLLQRLCTETRRREGRLGPVR